MKPNITLAETKTPNGGRMTLVEHDGSYCIRVNGQQLMHSAVSTSEIELGRLGCERHANRGAATRILIGGLGLGFTLRSVLQSTGPKAVVHVSELFPEIVAWNRTHLAGLNGGALADSRVRVLVEDVRSIIRRAAREPYDVIVLDIDNGTTAMVKDENNQLYSEWGMQQIALALKPGGRAAVWSACPDAVIEKRLTRAGFQVKAVPAKLYAQARRAAYMIYVADKPAGPVAATRQSGQPMQNSRRRL
jgi:spermidine synthase